MRAEVWRTGARNLDPEPGGDEFDGRGVILGEESAGKVESHGSEVIAR